MQAKSKKKNHRSDYRYWRRVIKEWEEQELSQEAFCNDRDYNFRQFRYYRNRLKKVDGPTMVNKPSVTRENSSTTFAPIVIKKPGLGKPNHSAAKPVVEKQGEFTLEFKNGMRCCIPNHFDAASLRRLVEVLQ